MALEKDHVTIGFMPLSDCAPLVVAQERGYFDRHGLSVTLSREQSWARIRDKVAYGELDAAQMLAPMVVASVLGLSPIPRPFLSAFSLNLNGNAITVSRSLFERMKKADPEAMAERPISAQALRRVLDEGGAEPMTFAMVFPFSSHNYELRYWLASAGIHPDRDVQIVVVPPSQVVEQLEAGHIDGFCVGEPWNTIAVEAGLGESLITSYDLWANSPEKVLGVTQDWAGENRNTHLTLLRALIEASQWLDTEQGRMEAAGILAQDAYLGLPEERILPSLTGQRRRIGGVTQSEIPDFNVFHRYAANFPWRSHAIWIMTQMIRWGQIARPVDFEAAARSAYRPHLYREAADAVGAAYPLIDAKTEGTHNHAWTMREVSAPIAFGPDVFFDRVTFDPGDPEAYLTRFEISHGEVTAPRAKSG